MVGTGFVRVEEYVHFTVVSLNIHPYGIRIDYSRKGFVLFNRKLNLLGMDKWNSIEELPLEEYSLSINVCKREAKIQKIVSV